ncbi:MAG: lasso peptide biosynthesis PqqD family chaperone [Romboutsia sp.]
MKSFKKSLGKIGNIRKDWGINKESLVLKNLEIDDTDLDGEKVMMNLDKGQYFMMNEVGSRIWDIIEKPMKVNEVIKTLTSEYDVDSKTCEDTVVDFLGRLSNADLISIS